MVDESLPWMPKREGRLKGLCRCVRQDGTRCDVQLVAREFSKPAVESAAGRMELVIVAWEASSQLAYQGEERMKSRSNDRGCSTHWLVERIGTVGRRWEDEDEMQGR